jgi:hypothetical protein
MYSAAAAEPAISVSVGLGLASCEVAALLAENVISRSLRARGLSSHRER